MAVWKTTNVFERNAAAWTNDKKVICNEGGTWSSKTQSVLQLLCQILLYSKKPLLCSIVSESLPHLKRNCIRDLERILGDSYDPAKFNKSNNIYSLCESKIEFFPADDASKLRGGRRDILFINECNNITKSSYDELEVRTRLCTFLDWNPVSEFWAHAFRGQPDVEWIHSTYKDALNVLQPADIQRIEKRRELDPIWWNVYGLGRVGNIIGLVHPCFQQVETIPEEEGIEFYGMDFGYTNDPTTLIYNKIIGDNLYSDQLIYQTGLTNQQIAAMFESLGVRKGYDEIFSDCAEPKSIDEIARYGYNIKPCPKGADSVINGIQFINQYHQFWTSRSIESIKEMRNYKYIEDKTGKLTNKPMHLWSHSMDGRRYGVVGKMKQPAPGDIFTQADMRAMDEEMARERGE